jgi:hypothetical protein
MGEGWGEKKRREGGKGRARRDKKEKIVVKDEEREDGVVEMDGGVTGGHVGRYT